MYNKFVCVVLLSVALLEDTEGKRSRKNKYVNNEAQDSTPQPSVLTYSTFGFNDVGSYDGFVPSSPDYANYLSYNRDPSTRLYAPAFPSAADSIASNAPQIGEEQTHVNSFQSGPMSFFTSPSAEFKEHTVINEGVYGQNAEDSLSYGAKLSSKSKNKIYNDFNNTSLNIFGSIAAITDTEASNEKNGLGIHLESPFDTKVGPSDTIDMHHNIYRQPFQSQFMENEHERPISTESPMLKFPKVVDFTKMKQNYPTSVENKYLDQKPLNIEGLENTDTNNNANSFGQAVLNHMYQSKYNFNKDIAAEKDIPKINTYHYQDNPENSVHIGQNHKHNKINTEYKDKLKIKPWYLNNDDRKKYNHMKGYEYSTNESSTSFKYDYGPPKQGFNNSVDEISPASSNHGFTSYQLPENEYTDIGKIPSIQTPFSQSSNVFPLYNQVKPVEEHTDDFKSPFTTIPTSSSHWGNIFKSTDFSIHKNHPWKPASIDEHDEIVHIPKKHENYKYTNDFDNKPNDWSHISNSYRQTKPNYKPHLDWRDSFNTRYKAEEDLLGLRTHDTSKPNYLPNYKPSYNDLAEEYDFRKLVEKWRQNYIRSKQKDALREHESYASDNKPIHVPMPKPYPIEVPHPVIVPVPQPYPVKVPVPKPVAVPVIRELTVPIVKPMPYPVIKHVPYPIEKPVPVPVVKQVHVPVEKPYPVAVPHIKPVFHHTKLRDGEPDLDEEYPPRPEKRPFNKKAKNYRSRPRPPPPPKRPSRMTYQDRNKRRPPHPTSSSNDHRHYRRPTSNRDHYRPHRYHDDFDEYENEPSDYALYCKRTGNC